MPESLPNGPELWKARRLTPVVLENIQRIMKTFLAVGIFMGHDKALCVESRYVHSQVSSEMHPHDVPHNFTLWLATDKHFCIC
ncbi:hypothetical protein GcM3_215030 [Golovinomyces cichoracearum]|uniref:Uncharacterized protein n=1 Tax=Golovinomyces cichoracearum TaxID=62708 RepID=A0A420H8N0_9PEZI|nr:hypothetical protein GcM3_215030 [Golovinomyces cichoracearum]